MTNFKILITTLLILSCLPVSAQVKDQIEWSLGTSPVFSEYATRFGEQEKQPESVFQVLRHNEFDIGRESVVRTVTMINYYPRFVDIEDYGSTSIYFTKNKERVTILSAYSISPNGTISQMLPESARFRDTNTYNTFSDQVELILPIPALEEGGFSVVQYQIITDRSAREMDWAVTLYTEENYPIYEFSLTATWQEKEEIQWSSNSHTVECTQTNLTVKCSGAAGAPFSSDDRINWRDHIGSISLGGLPSWGAVVSRVAIEMDKANTDTQGLDTVLAKLTAQEKNLEQKIDNIMSFVARDIRYISMSETGHSVTPHTIAETIANRYGDCKDKSVVLKALLQKIGIDSNLVLVSTNRSDPQKLRTPTMTVFNHIVVCFELNGKEYCLDPTNTQTNWRYMPKWIQGKVSLPLEVGYIPHALGQSEYRWQFFNENKIVFTDEGGQLERQSRTYLGEYAAFFRGKLVAKSESERQEYLQKHYADIVSSLAKPIFKLEKLNVMAPSFTINSEAKLPSFLDAEEDLIYEENDAWVKAELDEMRLNNTEYDEYFGGIRVQSIFEYDLNDVWSLTSVTPELSFLHEFGRLERKVTRIKDNKLIVTTDLKVPARMVSQREMKAFNRFLRTLARESLIRFEAAVVN